MSLYIVVGIFLLLGALYEFYNRTAANGVYGMLFAVLLFMLCFRYGQGTDYFGYQYIYEKVPDTLSISALRASSVHSEVGWKLLCVLFRRAGINFEGFVAVIGLITMMFLNRFIQKYCPLKVLALFLAYPTLYLTYIFSGMRQGLVMCVFLGVLLDWYIHKRHGKLVLGILLCATIHTASLVLLILLFNRVKEDILRYRHRLVVGCWIIGLVLSVVGARFTILGRSFSNESGGISYIAAMERVLSYVAIHMIYRRYWQSARLKRELIDDLIFLYVIGMMIYGALLSMPLEASRVGYFFKTIELAIFSNMLISSRQSLPDASVIMLYLSMLTMVMLVKNIDSYVGQGMYYSYINALNFPYNNIFIRGNYRYSIEQEILQ